jgi:hypothetical protein
VDVEDPRRRAGTIVTRALAPVTLQQAAVLVADVTAMVVAHVPPLPPLPVLARVTRAPLIEPTAPPLPTRTARAHPAAARVSSERLWVGRRRTQAWCTPVPAAVVRSDCGASQPLSAYPSSVQDTCSHPRVGEPVHWCVESFVQFPTTKIICIFYPASHFVSARQPLILRLHVALGRAVSRTLASIGAVCRLCVSLPHSPPVWG